VAYLGEPGVRRYLLRPALHGLALDLDAAAAIAAGEVMVVGIAAAAPVQCLAARIPDRVDLATLAQHLKVPVHGGEADVLAAAPKLGMNLLRTAESWQAIEGSR
jgi:hypothetical protein